MTPPDPLANLHPLREPALTSWWPPAPGWWLLMAIAVFTLALLTWFLMRRHRAGAYRRQALVQLNKLHEDYQNRQDRSDYVAGTNALLKSVALQAFPAREVAASSGAEWVRFLNSRATGSEPFQADFVSAAYSKDCPDIDTDQLTRAARSWIKNHRVAT